MRRVAMRVSSATRDYYFIVKRQSGGIYFFDRARDDLSLIRARLNHTSLDCTRRSVPAGTDGNGRAYQNRFKARLISRSTQIKPLALDEPSPDQQTRANVTNCVATRV